MDRTTPIAVETTPIATVCAAASNRSQPSAPKLGGTIRVNTCADGIIQVTSDSGLIRSMTNEAITVPTSRPEKANRMTRSRRGSECPGVNSIRRITMDNSSIAVMITRMTQTIPSARG